MRIRIDQNYCGKFNMLSNEESFSFHASIVDDENKPITEGENKAHIHFSGEVEERHDFRNPIEDIQYVFERCMQYAMGIISTRDYKGDTLLFAKTYVENFLEIQENFKKEKEKEIKEKIQKLNERLERGVGLGEISWECKNEIDKHLKFRIKWRDDHASKLKDFKKNTDGWKEEKEKVDKYQSEIDRYQSVKDHIDKCENINGAAEDGLKYLDHYLPEGTKVEVTEEEWDKMPLSQRTKLLHDTLSEESV